MDWTPIRKILVGAVAAAVAYGLRRLGVDLGSAAVNELAVAAVGFVFAYLVPDPKVNTGGGLRS